MGACGPACKRNNGHVAQRWWQVFDDSTIFESKMHRFVQCAAQNLPWRNNLETRRTEAGGTEREATIVTECFRVSFAR